MGVWDTTTPAGSANISEGDDRIREMKVAIQEALKANDATLGDEGVFPVDVNSPKYRYRGLKGTTAQRPTAGNYGFYYNTTTGTLQRDNGSTWDDITIKPRNNLEFGGSLTGADRYFVGTTSVDATETGFVMHRAGSIIGYSVGGITQAFTSNTSFIFRIRKNGSDVIVASTLTWTANSQNQDTTGTAASGTHTFIAGDRIEVFADYQSGTATIIARALIEVDLNS